MNEEGKFKKRAVKRAVIDVDDIKQTITKDRVFMVEVPEEKYMVLMKELFAWLDEAKKELYEIMNSSNRGYGDLEEAIVKWFGTEEKKRA